MAIIKNGLKTNFSIIPNYVITARNISGNVKELLYLFYMLPEKWEPNQRYFATQLNVTNRTIERYIAELKQKNYMRTVKNNKGLNTYDYELIIPTKMSEYIPTSDDIPIPTSHIPTEMSEHINTNTLVKLNDINNTYIEELREIFKKYYKSIAIRFETKEVKKELAKSLKVDSIENIKLGLENYLISQKGTEIRYIKSCHRFLKNEMWKDYLSVTCDESNENGLDSLKNKYF